MTPKPTALPPDPLPGRLIHLFAGLCYVFVAIGFTYLDRRYRFFPGVSLFWALWAGVGFTAGALTWGRGAAAGKTLSTVMMAVAVLLAIFPAFFMYPLARWACIVLLLVTGARGPVMHNRRDLYLCLTTCFTVSFMAATHHTADWTLWVYLGPAWLFAALALTWDYASSKAIGHGARLGMTTGFIAVTALVAMLLFVFLPRPPVLGFGFIPPADEAAGLPGKPAGPPGGQSSKPPAGGSGEGQGNSDAGSAGGSQDTAGGSWLNQWQDMLGTMRSALKDPAMPQWQKGLLGALLGQAPGGGEAAESSGEGASGQAHGKSGGGAFPFLLALLILLLAMALAWLVYKCRYRLGLELMHIGAWLLARHQPLMSMRLSAVAMRYCLTNAGHVRKPGQSLREYLAAAPALPALSRRWLAQALALYGETRFGQIPATPQRARDMQQAVSAATELIKGHAPELAQAKT